MLFELLAMEFLRTRFAPVPAAPVLSLRAFRGRDDGVVVMCSFCLCLKRRSRRAKHREQSGHSNGFSLVCDRSWRFRCSSRANDRPQVVQTCGRGLSVLGGGIFVLAPAWPFASVFLVVSLEGGADRLHRIRNGVRNGRICPQTHPMCPPGSR